MGNVRDEILSLLEGREYNSVLTLLSDVKEQIKANSIKRLPISKCPKCGNQSGYVSDTYSGPSGDRHKSGKVVTCLDCKFAGPRVSSHRLRGPVTEVILINAAVAAWNNLSRDQAVFAAFENATSASYQHDLFTEETFELILALTRAGSRASRSRRYDRDEDISDIISEMADVIICTHQWLYSNGVSFDRLYSEIDGKMERSCKIESVRSAIAELLKRITTVPLTSASSADSGSTNPR